MKSFKILQIADNMWLLQILSKFVVFFFLEAQQDEDFG